MHESGLLYDRFFLSFEIMNHIKRIAVFCGSSLGKKTPFRNESLALAGHFHRHGIGLVYGGGNIGLMGILADEMLKLGGEVIGVIPKKLVALEVAHTGLTELLIVDSMLERKARMMELSDAFVILPGGTGTLDEFFEVFTYKQLGYHAKPIAILNVSGFYDPLLELLENLSAQGFLDRKHPDALIVSETLAEMMEKILLNDTGKSHKSKR